MKEVYYPAVLEKDIVKKEVILFMIRLIYEENYCEKYWVLRWRLKEIVDEIVRWGAGNEFQLYRADNVKAL